MIDDREIVWLPKKLAEEIKTLEDDAKRDYIIKGFIDESKREIKANLASLEDDVIQYKAMMINARKAFEDAKNEQLTASYELWEKFEEDLPKLREKVQVMKNAITPVKNELEEVKDLIGGVDTLQIERLLEVLKEVSQYLSYDGDTGKILRFLFDNYKKKS